MPRNRSRSKVAAVYVITNTVNGKTYVGSSVNARKRLGQHRLDLSKGKHANRKLQGAWLKYGPDAFEFRLIEIVDDLDQLLIREQAYITEFQSVARGYNIRLEAASNRGLTGRPVSKRHRENLSKSLLGHTVPDEVRRKISETLTGRRLGSYPPERIAKAAESLKGRVVSEEAKANMRRSRLRYLAENGSYTRTPAQNAKLAQSQKRAWAGRADRKLDPSLAAEIRAIGKSMLQREIAAKFGIARQTVSKVLNGQLHADMVEV